MSKCMNHSPAVKCSACITIPFTLPEAQDVNHPSHYNTGKIEVIDAIEDWGLNFARGNAVKYIARAGHKDPSKEIEDLEKAKWYIIRELERLKGG